MLLLLQLGFCVMWLRAVLCGSDAVLDVALPAISSGGLISFSSESFFNLFDLLCFLKSSVWGMGDDLLAQHSDIHSVHMLFNLIVLTSTPLILMG